MAVTVLEGSRSSLQVCCTNYDAGYENGYNAGCIKRAAAGFSTCVYCSGHFVIGIPLLHSLLNGSDFAFAAGIIR